MLGTGPLLGQALQNAWDRPALGTGPSKCLGQALLNAWDRPALGTGPSKFLGQARPWDRPFKMLGTSPLLGQALQNAWGRPALGTGPSKFLGLSKQSSGGRRQRSFRAQHCCQAPFGEAFCIPMGAIDGLGETQSRVRRICIPATMWVAWLAAVWFE